MQISVKRFEKSLESDWDDFVENRSINGTFLHTRKFYNHNPLNVADDHSLLFYRDGKIAGVIPFNVVTDGGQKVLHSYLRATYGGLIVDNNSGIEAVNQMIRMVIDEARVVGANEIIIRNPFRIFNSNFCDESDYAMWRNGFKIKYRELEVAIQLGSGAKEYYSDATARSIQKGKKALSVTESEEFEKYWQVLEANLAEKHSTSPTHSHQQFIALLENVGRDRIKLFAAKLDNELIAGIVLFIVNKNAVHAQY